MENRNRDSLLFSNHQGCCKNKRNHPFCISQVTCKNINGSKKDSLFVEKKKLSPNEDGKGRYKKLVVKQWNEQSREDFVFPKNRSDNFLQELKKHNRAILG